MKLKYTRNIVRIDTYQSIFVKKILNKNFHTTIIKINKTNLTITKKDLNENNLYKLFNSNFTKKNKNIENMKFEVFKTKDAEPKLKSVLNNAISNTSQTETKPKIQQQEIKGQFKSDSPNMKFTKYSQLDKHKKQSPQSLASPIQIHKAIKKELKINPNKTFDIDPDNPNAYSFNNNLYNKTESSESLKFQTVKTIFPFKQENSNTNNSKQNLSTDKYDLDNSSQSYSNSFEYEESQNQTVDTIAEEENFNEAELEFLANKDKQRFGVEESEGFASQADDSAMQERDLPLLQLDYSNEKDSLSASDQEDSILKYNTLNDILNIYANDPIYKKTFDEAKRVSICEMRTDVLFSAKCFLMLQNFSSLFILGQLAFQGFSLTWIFMYLCVKYFLTKFNRGYYFSVIKMLADPATMRLDVYSVNLLGMEVCRSYSTFQIVRSLEGYDFSAYEFHRDELVRNDFIVHKICKINNENFFKNIFLVLSRNFDNEFLFKYYHLMYSFTKREMNENLGETPQQQENFFRSIVKEYFSNFPNYLPYLKEKLGKNLDYKYSEYDERIYVMFALYCFAFLLFMFDYFVYKYLISVHHNEVEGGIEKLYEEEREKNLNKKGLQI